jgi:uncharacterized protein YaaW (UPF0174 family)
MARTLDDELSGWSQQQLCNLGAILQLKKDNPSVEELGTRIKWLFHSKTRANITALKNRIVERGVADGEGVYPVPMYSDLILALADKLKLNAKHASIEDLQLDISYAIIVKALQKMTQSQRRVFFSNTINLGEIFENIQIRSPDLRGPVTTMAALGLAHGSGMSLYVASTTALGFVTHAVGITLPFAIYTGLGSTIAFMIGPAGWLAAGGWAVFKLTGPEWGKLTPAIMYIISTNSHRRMLQGEGSD